MKRNKKTILIILSVTSAIMLSVVLVIVLFCPLSKEVALDGGSTFYSATLYKIVKWNNGYTATRIYWFPDNFKSYDELMEMEKARDDFWDYVENKGIFGYYNIQS